MAARDKAVCGIPVDIGEVDQQLALWCDGQVRDDRVDRTIIQSRNRSSKRDGNQHASSTDRSAESSGDLGVGTPKSFVLIEVGIGRITGIHADTQLRQPRLLA